MPLNITSAAVKYNNPSGLGTNPFTMEGWFYLDDVATQQYFMHIHTTGDASFYTTLQLAAGFLNVQCAGITGPTGNTPIIGRKWYHLVLSHTNVGNPSVVKIWIDGVPETFSSPGSNGTADHTGSVLISGRAYDTNRRFTRGTAHKVRIYNVAISSDVQVAAAYADPTNSPLINTYAANCVFRADLDATTDATCANGTQSATVSGTSAVLTERYPLDIPGAAVILDPRSNSNTITSGRISTFADLSGNGNSGLEEASNGPLLVDTSTGIAVKNAHFGYSAASVVQRIHTTGPYVNNRSSSVVCWASVDKLSTSNIQQIIQLGRPTAETSGRVEFGINGSRLRAGSDGAEFLLSSYATSSTPRMLGVVCSSANVVIYNDKLTTTGSALTSSTGNGYRVGDQTGTLGQPFNGSLFMLAVYQRPLSALEMNALYEWGKPFWKYADAEYVLTIEGSSTADGYGINTGENIPYQLAAVLPNYYIYNFSNSGENRAHFNTQYSAQCGAAPVLAGFDKAHRFALIQVFGNDWNGSTSLTDIQTGAANNYAEIYGKFTADYSNVLALYPQPRTDYDDAGDVNRELDAISFMTWSDTISNVTIVPRPAELRPVSSTLVDIRAVSQNVTYYQGDEVHLTVAGILLLVEETYSTLQDLLFPQSSSITAYTSKLLGNMLISAGVDENFYVEAFDARMVSAGYFLSTRNVSLGGLPLALYENASGRRAVAVVFDDNVLVNQSLKTTVFYGSIFKVKHSIYKYTFGVKKGSGSQILGQHLFLGGEIIGVSDSNQIEMVEVILPSTDEERTYMVGGTPMLARRSGNRWYMVVHTVS